MAWHSGVNTRFGAPAFVGAVALLVGFGGFGTWAAVAPLQGAVMAPGTIAVSSRNKVVQHLEGGVVSEILVRDGDRVAAGDPIVRLDLTAAESARNRLRDQASSIAILEARILAERDGLSELTYSAEIVEEAKRQGTEQALADQTAEFKARLNRHKTEIEILQQKIAARSEEIVGIEAYVEGIRAQQVLLAEERTDADGLLQKGLVSKGRVLQLKRAEADLKGNEGQMLSRIAQAREAIAETREEIHHLEMKRLEEASSKLIDARVQRADVLERLRSAQDMLDRVIVRAPSSGTVIKATKFNAGAVVAPGQELMEIVPDDSELIVEAHVRPVDIDEVRLGQPARLSFTALDHRLVPQVPGEVTLVSADRLVDNHSGEPFYLVQLKISKEPLNGFNPARLGAGQPAEVFITTRERTFLNYLVDPIAKTFMRGMREN